MPLYRWVQPIQAAGDGTGRPKLMPNDYGQFTVWDPANDRSHTVNQEQLYDYTYDAEMIGTASVLVSMG